MIEKWTSEQLQAYANSFFEGDAVYSGGKWARVSSTVDDKGKVHAYFSGKYPWDPVSISGQSVKEGDKIVWLGLDSNSKEKTFGRPYQVILDENGTLSYENDKGFRIPISEEIHSSSDWGFIPKYENTLF